MQVVGVKLFSMLKSSLLSHMSVGRSDGMTEIASRFVSAATVRVKFHPQAERESISESLMRRDGHSKAT